MGVFLAEGQAGFRSDRNTTQIMRWLQRAREAARLKINIGKTKTPVFRSKTIKKQMKVGNTDLVNVSLSLGTMIVERRLRKE